MISFNFDCWLCEDIKKNIRFDYLLNFDDIDPSRKFYKENQGKGTPLIKLNGSLDWLFNPTTKEIRLLHKNIKPDIDYYNEELLADRVEPYIFLPHQQKDELTKPLWNRTKKELKQASKVTIIGYSFPDYDGDIIKLFQENITPAIELEVVDLVQSLNEQEEIKAKYERLFPNIDIAKVKFCFGGFEGYLDQLKSVVI